MEKLTLATRINTLVKEYPFLIEFLAGRNSRFELLRNKMMRATLGRLATLGKVAAIGDEEPAQLLEALAAEIERQTGRRPEIELAGGEPPADEERLAAMKELIEGLHRGLPHEEAKALFDELIADVSPEQIAELISHLPEPIANICEFLAYTGRRLREVLNLRIEDVRRVDLPC